jgi:hypothetical protein
MKIAKRTTSRTQDTQLFEELYFLELNKETIEKLVNVIYDSIKLSEYAILNRLWEMGYGFMDKELVESIMEWIENYSDILSIRNAS